MWPPGQPADVKSGRLVFNTNVHGVVFNTAAGRQTLARFMEALRANPSAIFPPQTFQRMKLQGGSGLRLVNSPAFPCACGRCRVAVQQGRLLPWQMLMLPAHAEQAAEGCMVLPLTPE